MFFKLARNHSKEFFTFPVNPPEYKISGGGTSFQDFNVLAGGDATVFGGEALKEVSFSSFFPAEYDEQLCNVTADRFVRPWEAVDFIEQMRREKRPVYLTIGGGDGAESETYFNLPVTIRTFNYAEAYGAVGDISFDISFKEYRFIQVRKIVDDTAVTAAARPDMQPEIRTYVVQKGDCLWNIAKKFYGNGNKWPTIYEANKSVIGKNPNLIYPGQKYVIP